MRTQNLIQAVVFFCVLTIGFVHCKKSGTDAAKQPDEILSVVRGGGTGSIDPLPLSQRVLITKYDLTGANLFNPITIHSLDPLFERGIFGIKEDNFGSLLMFIKLSASDTVFVKQTTNITKGSDDVQVYYQGIEYRPNDDPTTWDEVNPLVKNASTVAIILRRDLKDLFSGSPTPRYPADLSPNRMLSMVSANYGPTASASQRSARASMMHFANFWGCTGVTIQGIDTSCEPWDQHGICVTTISWTGNCPWYTIPFGLA